MSDAGSALDPNSLGDSFIAGNSFFHRLCHTILALADSDFFGNYIVLAGLHLPCFCAVTCELVRISKHRTTRRHAK